MVRKVSQKEKEEVVLSQPTPHPFVKWAGGKVRLTGMIAKRIPTGLRYNRYLEPFVGAGAMFFWIRRSFPKLDCTLGDLNEELMLSYRAIRDYVEAVSSKLETHSMMHSEDHYYAVRKSKPRRETERAARFIYLNRTCFNGLYRVNRKGQFNVPIGKYRDPKILDRENLLAVSAVLKESELITGDFGEITDGCGSGTLVYLDPPYSPISEKTGFTEYTRAGFKQEDQERLAKMFLKMIRNGATVILSNSDTPFVRKLYSSLRPSPSLEAIEVARSINSKASGRGRVKELLIHYHP